MPNRYSGTSCRLHTASAKFPDSNFISDGMHITWDGRLEMWFQKFHLSGIKLAVTEICYYLYIEMQTRRQ